jgi:lysozyme
VVKLLSTQETWLKALPEQASTLKPHQLIKIVSGQTLAVRDQNIFEDKGGHFKVVFDKPLGITLDGVKIAEMPIGYIYGSHWKGISAAYAEKAAVQTRFSPAGSSIVLQPAPLLIQNDNKDWGDDGSASNLRYGAVQCGLTSAAMLIASIWPNAKVAQLAGESEGGQFENWVAGQFKRIGAESTSMEGHVAVLAALGIKSVARRDATIGDLKQALHQHPVIMGTAYKASGHFVCGVGVADKPGDLPDKWPVGRIDTPIAYPQDADQAGVIINCPYGHRDFSGSGNNWFDIAQNMTDTFGLHNVVTNSILERFWVDGGEESGWAVFVDPATPNAGNRSEKPVELSSTLPPKSDAIAGTPRRYKPQELRLNSIAVEIIKSFEGLELSQYFCSAGVSTIGLGTTRWHDGGAIPAGATITEAQAIEFFKRDSEEFIDALRDLIDRPITGKQAAALTSWIYNCGIGALEESTLRKVINSGGDDEAVKEQLRRWTNQGLAGLIKRRESECELWSGGDWKIHR